MPLLRVLVTLALQPATTARMGPFFVSIALFLSVAVPTTAIGKTLHISSTDAAGDGMGNCCKKEHPNITELRKTELHNSLRMWQAASTVPFLCSPVIVYYFKARYKLVCLPTSIMPLAVKAFHTCSLMYPCVSRRSHPVPRLLGFIGIATHSLSLQCSLDQLLENGITC